MTEHVLQAQIVTVLRRNGFSGADRSRTILEA